MQYPHFSVITFSLWTFDDEEQQRDIQFVFSFFKLEKHASIPTKGNKGTESKSLSVACTSEAFHRDRNRLVSVVKL